MVKDIYEKINSLKKADLEGLYSNYMTVNLEEDQKDEKLIKGACLTTKFTLYL